MERSRKSLLVLLAVLTVLTPLLSRHEFPSPIGSRGTALQAGIAPAGVSLASRLGVDDVFWAENQTGLGSSVAVLDTGILPSHEAFAGKTITWRDVTRENYTSPVDISGHGTRCASVLAGNSSTYKGIAPGADIVAIKMFYRDGTKVNADNIDALAAINFSISNMVSLGIAVASLSWGDDNESDGQDELSIITERLVDAGIVTVVAAGNVEGELDRVAAPGASPRVITVGALDSFSLGVASFSLQGPTADGRFKPDIVAPGTSVMFATPPGPDTYGYGSGTSFATPVVSGISLLLLERYPGLDHAAIKQLLTMTALECEYTRGRPDNHEGWGMVNPAGAVLAMDNAWNGSGSLHVPFEFSKPSRRSYFTRVTLPAGESVQFALDVENASFPFEQVPGGVLDHFEAYLYEIGATDEHTPILAGKSSGSRLFFTSPDGGDYMLAIKPLPSAWSLNGGTYNFTIRLSQDITSIIGLATVAAVISSASSAVIIAFLVGVSVVASRKVYDA